jgi:hypothetical protein
LRHHRLSLDWIMLLLALAIQIIGRLLSVTVFRRCIQVLLLHLE